MARKTVLIIDDDKSCGKSLKWTLESTQRYEVIFATCGRTGLEIIKQNKVDLVLLDIAMPEMDGFETLQKIKAINKDLPVCMVTGVWDDSEGKKCLEAGAYHYVTKPIDHLYLRRVISMKLFGFEEELFDEAV